MKRYIISLIYITILLITTAKADLKHGFRKLFVYKKESNSVTDQINPFTKTNLTSSCDTYQDCYNCTLANCAWNNEVCDIKKKQTLPPHATEW